MQIKRGFRQALVSAVVFAGIIVALMYADPRVSERMRDLVVGGNGITSWHHRAGDLVEAMVTAVRYQSIDNAPVMVFGVVGAILFVFMART